MRTVLAMLAALSLLGACHDSSGDKEAESIPSDGAPPSDLPQPKGRISLMPRARLSFDSGIGEGGSDAPIADAGPVWDGAMPPRPVPKASPTVGSGAPMEQQMQAIAYMAAMTSPKIDDAPADATYAQTLATQLKPIAMSLDHGSADEKAKLNRVEVVAGGRKIDLLMANGCDSETPRRAVVTRANVPLSTLLGHGVLVVRCNDARVQCLQSTRDPTDVLCTTAPRHK